MPSNIKHIFDLTNKDIDATSIFCRLELPVCTSQEYRFREINVDSSPSVGGIVFLSRYGCTLHIRDDNTNTAIKHPHLAKPLFSRKVGGLYCDIFPGMGIPTEKEALEFHRIIKSRGLTEHDGHQNIAYVPATSPAFPVCFDIDMDWLEITGQSVDDLTEKCYEIDHRYISGSPLKVSAEDLLNEFYAPLRALMEDAWPEGQDEPDPNKIMAFWAECKKWKEAGLLRSPWMDDDHDEAYHEVTTVAENYEEHIRRYER